MKKVKKALSRREMFTLTGATIAGASLAFGGSGIVHSQERTDEVPSAERATPNPIVVPNGTTLQWKMIDGVVSAG
jgi:hypothetical protein